MFSISAHHLHDADGGPWILSPHRPKKLYALVNEDTYLDVFEKVSEGGASGPKARGKARRAAP